MSLYSKKHGSSLRREIIQGLSSFQDGFVEKGSRGHAKTLSAGVTNVQRKRNETQRTKDGNDLHFM